jgi:hypothetical protein
MVRDDAADNADAPRRHDAHVLALGQCDSLQDLRGPDECPLTPAVEPDSSAAAIVVDSDDDTQSLAAGLIPANEVLGCELLCHTG